MGMEREAVPFAWLTSKFCEMGRMLPPAGGMLIAGLWGTVSLMLYSRSWPFSFCLYILGARLEDVLNWRGIVRPGGRLGLILRSHDHEVLTLRRHEVVD